MDGLKMISGYRDIEPYRLSFNRLAQNVFGINFEAWYQKGFWDGRYICHSYLAGDEIVANASVNLMDLVLNGRHHSALQIGTVMTHPDYRGKGLSSRLIRHVLDQYRLGFDLIYLFANKDVLDYYPKFGFKPCLESQFEITVKPGGPKPDRLRKLNTADPDDLGLIARLTAERDPVSRVFGVQKAVGITMWYCFNILAECFYYLPEENAVVVMEKGTQTVFLYDIIFRGDIDFKKIIPKLASDGVQRILFGFTPDRLNVDAERSCSESEGGLFVITHSAEIPNCFKHPVTAQA